MAKLLDYMTIPFSKEYLSFKPLVEEGIPEEMQVWDLEWFENCLTSTKVMKSNKVDLSKLTEEELGGKEEVEKANKQIPIYEKFVKEASKQIHKTK